MFLQIEEGKKYKQNDGSSPDAAGNAGLSRSFGTKQADNGWSWVPSKFKRNSDGVKPADCGGLSADEFSLQFGSTWYPLIPDDRLTL